MTKVLIIQRTFEHYRIPVFSELASREDIDLIVSFPYEGRKKSNYADVELPYQHINLSVKNSKLPFIGEVFKYSNLFNVISESNPDVIIVEGNPRIVTLYKLFNFAKLNNYKIIAWTKFDNKQFEVKLRQKVLNSKGEKDGGIIQIPGDSRF